MISERRLKRWRKEVLQEIAQLKGWDSASEFTRQRRVLIERILLLTQELLDQKLLEKGRK